MFGLEKDQSFSILERLWIQSYIILLILYIIIYYYIIYNIIKFKKDQMSLSI